MLLFLSYLISACTPGTDHIASCDGGIISSCDASYKVSINSATGEVIGCVACSTASFCDGVTEQVCEEVNGQICSNGLITKCRADGSNNYLLIKQPQVLDQCVTCDFGFICDGTVAKTACENTTLCQNGVVQLCPLGSYILLENSTKKTSCQTCGGDVCDGKTKTLCGNVANIFSTSSCENGLVKQCKLKFKLSTDKVKCLQCSASFMCNGMDEIKCNSIDYALSCKDGLVTQCRAGYKLLLPDNTSCTSCGQNQFCDGEKEGPCKLDGSRPNAISCQGGIVTECIGSQLPNVDGDNCTNCQDGYFCNGFNESQCNTVSNAVSCKDGKVSECFLGYKIEINQQECSRCTTVGEFCDGIKQYDCPEEAECIDGFISKCAVGQYVSDDSISCSECSETMFCNGYGVFDCSSINFAENCENGLISKCNADYLLAPSLSECLPCPQERQCDGTQSSVCPLGTFPQSLVCSLCPDKMVCNGVGEPTSCPANQIPAANQAVCISDPSAVSKKMSIGAIVGIAVGIFAIVFIIGLVFYIRWQTKKKLSAQQEDILKQIGDQKKPIKKGEIIHSVVVPTDDSIKTFQTNVAPPILPGKSNLRDNAVPRPAAVMKEIEVVNGQQSMTESDVSSYESSELEEVPRQFLFQEQKYDAASTAVTIIPIPKVNNVAPPVKKKVSDLKKKKEPQQTKEKRSSSKKSTKGKTSKAATKEVRSGSTSLKKKKKSVKTDSAINPPKVGKLAPVGTVAKKPKSTARKPGVKKVLSKEPDFV